MFGDVTPVLVPALLKSPAKKVLLPLNKRKVEDVGAEGQTLDALIDHAADRLGCWLRSSVVNERIARSPH